MLTSPARRLRGALLFWSAAALLGCTAPEALADERVVARDAHSTTTRSADGTFRTRSYPEPVNFRDEAGAWRPIERQLVTRPDGTAHPKAIAGDVAIPASMNAPIRFEHGGAAFSFRLRSAGGERNLAGTKATFDGAMSSVDVTYKALGNGVKETIRLEGRRSPRRFVYDVQGPADLKPAVDRSGDIVFTDAAGDERFRVAAPIAWDSAEPHASYSNALTLSIAAAGTGRWTMTMAADDAWLDDPARVYPVLLDPDYYMVDADTGRAHGAEQDCVLATSATDPSMAATSFCALSFMQVGQGSLPRKSILRFGTPIPPASVVTDATLMMWHPASSVTAVSPMRVHTITKDWDNDASWNEAKLGDAWATPGGDVSTDPALTGSPINVGAGGYWYYWPVPLDTVNGWVNGTLPNHGLQVATDPGAPNATYIFTSSEGDQQHWPALDITWRAADTTLPTLTLSGELASGQDTWRTAGSGELTLDASDSESGVQHLEISKGGQALEAHEVPCAAGGCSLSHTFTVDLAGLGDGIHQLQAAATDVDGNTKTMPLTVRVDRGPPALSVTGTLATQQGVVGASGTRAASIQAADSGAGVTRVAVTIDGRTDKQQEQTCPQGACGLQTDWQIDLATLGDGPHAVVVTATDAAGRTTSEEYEIEISRYAMPAAPPLSETSVDPFLDQISWLYEGASPLQDGVQEGAIDERRPAVITGKVFNDQGVPAAGVTVSIAGHPEYGTTVSRESGEYFLAVSGGQQYRVHLEVQGALPVDREIETKWNDYAVVDDVHLTPLDPKKTAVEFGALADELQVASSSTVSDDDGSRQARVLVRPGTEAWMVMPDGSQQPLVAGDLRVTEYTVGEDGPEQMPASLPRSSAYTWAADFRIDQAAAAGAEHVRFSKPVAAYVENFLELPVGVDIPVGTYEPSEGAWKGDPDGRVIKIIAEQNGRAVLDVTGFGEASQAELDHLNIDDAELHELASAYDPGESLWRTQLAHFSSVDWNHAFAILTAWQQKSFDEEPESTETDEPCEKPGSIIGCQNQTLGEIADLGGTPYHLRYDSARTPGATGSRTIKVPLTGNTVREDLKAVDVEVKIAGKRYTYSVKDPEPNEMKIVRWDGRDVFDRPMVGGAVAYVTTRDVYPSRYDPIDYAVPARPEEITWIEMPYFSGGTRVSWNGIGGGRGVMDAISSLGVREQSPDRPALECNANETHCWYEKPAPVNMSYSREGTPVARDYKIDVPYMDARSAGVGGWGLSEQHRYDPATATLYTGDGQRHSAESFGQLVTTMRSSDGHPDDDSSLRSPLYLQGLAHLPDGSAVVSDPDKNRLLRFTPDGHTELFAGDGRRQDAGDGGPATQASIGFPQYLAGGPDGSIYVSNYDSKSVRRIAPDGTITRVLGNGTSYPTPGAAESDPLGVATTPRDMTVASDGTLYVAAHEGIRRLGPDGRAELILSSKQSCSAEDDCYWSGYLPTAIAVTDDGTLYWRAQSWASNVGMFYRLAPGSRQPELLMNILTFDEPVDGPIEDANIDIRDITIDAEGKPLILGDGGLWRLTDDGNATRIGYSCTSWDPAADRQGTIRPLRDACGTPYLIDQGPAGTLIADLHGDTVATITSGLARYANSGAIVPSDDATEAYQFDASGRHLATLDAVTERTIRTFSYDQQGRLAAINETDLGTTTITYAGSRATVTGPNGQTTQIDTNSGGWATKITDPAGSAEQYQYTSEGLLTDYTDQRGNSQSFTWGPTGRLTTDTSRRGHAQTLARTENLGGATVTHTTAAGDTTTFDTAQTGEGHRRLTITAPDQTQRTSDQTTTGTRLTEADGTITETSEQSDPRWAGVDTGGQTTTTLPSGRTLASRRSVQIIRDTSDDPKDPFAFTSMTTQTTTGGRTTTTSYDKDARTATTQSPMGRATTVTFDEEDRPVTISSPGKADAHVTYDEKGRVTSTSVGNATQSLQYGSDGRPSTLTDAEGRTTQIARDALGRPTTVTTADGTTTTSTYDQAGNLTSITSPDGRQFTFDYDADGNLTRSTRPPRAGSTETNLVGTVFYDTAGRPKTVTTPSGNQVTTTYDAGKLSGITATDGASITSTFEAAADGGRLTSLDSSDGASTSYEYDGKLTTRTQTTGDTEPGDATANAPAVEYGYDNTLRPTSETVDGDTLTATYDDDDDLTRVGDVHFNRNPLTGQTTSITAGQTETNLQVDDRDQLTSQSHFATTATGTQPVLGESLVRDRLGRITQRTETLLGATNTYDYTYDPAGRLTQVTTNGTTSETYAYDSSGGLSSRGTGLFTSWIETDGHGRATRTATGTQLTWDADGQITSLDDGQGTSTFTYNGLGRLTNINLPDNRQATYTYDAQGRRTALAIDGQLKRRWLYSGNPFPIARIDADGDIVERYVYGRWTHVPDLIERRDGQRLRLITDTLGNVRATIDADTGEILQRLAYDSYGTVTNDTNPGLQPFGFKGTLSDPALDAVQLRWMGARLYSPATARFTTADPAGLVAGWNAHDALGGDPINLADPLGALPSLTELHDTLSDIATGGSIATLGCLAVLGPTGVGATACSATALVAAGAGVGALAVDVVLFARGKGDPVDAVTDVAGVVTGGASRVGKAVAGPLSNAGKSLWTGVEAGANLLVDALARVTEWIEEQLDPEPHREPCPI